MDGQTNNTGVEEEDDDVPYWAWIILAVALVLIIVIIIVVLLCCGCCGGGGADRADVDADHIRAMKARHAANQGVELDGRQTYTARDEDTIAL